MHDRQSHHGRPRAGRLVLPALLLLLASGCRLNSTAQNAEGVRLYQQAQYPAAAARFQQAIYGDPRSADAHYNLAATYHQQGVASQQQSSLDQAESYYNLCLDRNPNHRDCHRALAVLLLEQGRDDEAFRLIEGWAARSPALADPKVELARLSEEFGERETAKQHLLAALAVQPNNPRALAALGRIREDLGEQSQALADYQRSLSYNRLQPEVAARVAALQTAVSRAPLASTSGSGTASATVPSGRLK